MFHIGHVPVIVVILPLLELHTMVYCMLMSGQQCCKLMMKVCLFMTVFKNYSRIGAYMHTANHATLRGDTPRDQDLVFMSVVSLVQSS